MAATPTAMQMKKNSSRRHEARVSRTAIRRTNLIRVHLDVLDDTAVAQDQPRVGHRRQLGVVRHQDERRAARTVDLPQQLHDVAAVGAVEVAGWLVGQHDRRVVGQGAGERDALLLAAGELRRIVMRRGRSARLRRAASWRGGGASGAPAISIGTATFSKAVSDGMRWKNWKTKPIFSPRSLASASSSSRVMSTPSMITEPEVGASRPAISPSSVDLPLPDGPTMATNWPRPDVDRQRMENRQRLDRRS